MSARWGKPFQDLRHWPTYNETLVLRGEFYLDLRPLRQWDQELALMNRGKRGGQYQVPPSFIRWLALWKQWVDYRGLEGICRRMVQLGRIPHAPDSTPLWHRLHGLTPTVGMPHYPDLELASDGTGRKTSNAGEYRIFRSGDPEARRRKHLVVVITADVRRKKVMGIEVHIEGKGHSESRSAAAHVRAATERGDRVRKFSGGGLRHERDVYGAARGGNGAGDQDPEVGGLPDSEQWEQLEGAEEGGAGVSGAGVCGVGGAEGVWDALAGHRKDHLGGEAEVWREHGGAVSPGAGGGGISKGLGL